MTGFPEWLGHILRRLLKLVFGLALAVLALGFLLAVLLLVLGMTVWALLTGRKPAPAALFTRFQQTSQRYTQGVWPGGAPGSHSARYEASEVVDVVDVVAHEVPEPAPTLGPSQHKRPSP